MDPTASFRITATDETSAAIRSAAKNLHELERPIRDLRLLSEAVIGGFGFSKLLEGFDAVAKKAEGMGTAQSKAILDAKKATDEFTDAVGELEVEFAAKLSPAIERAAMFWTDILKSTGVDAQIGRLNEQIVAIQKLADAAAKSGKTDDLSVMRVKVLNKEVNDLIASRDELIKTPEGGLFGNLGDKFKIDPKDFGAFKTEASKQMGDLWQQIVDESKFGRLDEDTFKITVDKTPQLRRMPEFTPEADALAASLAAAKKEAKAFADTFTASFESRGIQALLDGDLSGAVKGLAKDFAELILKLTVFKPLAESISGWFTGAGGLGSLFTGGGAGGGAAAGGGLFEIESAGRARAAGVQINNYVAAGLPPQWSVSLGTAAQIAATQSYNAIANRMNGKR